MIPSKELIQSLIDQNLAEHADKGQEFDLHVDSYVSRGLYRAQYEINYGKTPPSMCEFDVLPFRAMQQANDYTYAIEYYQKWFRKKPYVFFGVDVADKRVYIVFQRVYSQETEKDLNAKNFPSNLYVDPKDVIDQLVAAYPDAKENIMEQYNDLLILQEEYPVYAGEIIKGNHTFDLAGHASIKFSI